MSGVARKVLVLTLATAAGCRGLPDAPRPTPNPTQPTRVWAPAVLLDFSPKVAKGTWAQEPWRHHQFCGNGTPRPLPPDDLDRRSRWMESCGFVPPPTEVTLRGSGFSVPSSRNSVFFGGILAEVVSGDATHLVVRPLGGPARSLISVRTSGAQADEIAAPDRSTLAVPMVFVGPPQQLSIVEGDRQAVVAGSRLAPIVVRLSDAAGRGVPEERVWFSMRYEHLGTGTAHISAETMTDASGLAKAEVVLPDVPGVVTIEARAVNVAAEKAQEPWTKVTATALPSETDLDTLLQQMRSDTPSDRWDAARALGAMGPLAKSTAPTLQILARSEDDSVHFGTLETLARIQPEAALPLVLPDLAHEFVGTRVSAAKVLEIMGPAAAPAAPALAEMLRNSRRPGQWAARLSGIEALNRLGKAAGPAVPELAEALGDTDRKIRMMAVETLWHIGPPESMAAIPELRKALADPELQVRGMASGALQAAGAMPGGARLVIVSDNNVRVSPGESVRLAVSITYDDGLPRSYAAVQFDLDQGEAFMVREVATRDSSGVTTTTVVDASLTHRTVQANASGVASTLLRMGKTPSRVVVHVTYPGATAVDFEITSAN